MWPLESNEVLMERTRHVATTVMNEVMEGTTHGHYSHEIMERTKYVATTVMRSMYR